MLDYGQQETKTNRECLHKSRWGLKNSPEQPFDVDNIHLAPASTSPTTETPRTLSATLKPQKRCPGLHLAMPPGVSPYLAYLFMLHTHFTLLWGIQIINDSLMLQSNKCTGIVVPLRADKCQACAQLANDGVVDSRGNLQAHMWWSARKLKPCLSANEGTSISNTVQESAVGRDVIYKTYNVTEVDFIWNSARQLQEVCDGFCFYLK